MQTHLKTMEPLIRDGIQLAMGLGASGACITYSHSSGSGISFEANKLKSCNSAESQSYSVSVISNHRCGTASGNIPERLQEVVRRAFEFAKYGATSHFDEFPEPQPGSLVIDNWSDSIRELTIDRQVQDCGEIVDRLLASDGSLVTEAAAGTSESECITANSAGFFDASRSTSWSLEGGFQKTTGTDMLFGGTGRYWGELNEFYSKDDILDDLLFDLGHSARIVGTQGGTIPLVIPPKVVRRFLSPVAGAISGRSVAKGTSPLMGKLGTQCFSSSLSIFDNPHIAFRGGAAHDSDGIPTAPRMLVENGVLNLFLYDYDTACMTGNKPTGHDGCAPHTMLVSPGQTPSDELIRSVSRGIYVQQMLGFGQTNMANGDFSANLSLGYLVENGEIVGRVKDAMISENIFELLKGDLQISSDIHPYYMQPHVVLPGVSLKV